MQTGVAPRPGAAAEVACVARLAKSGVRLAANRDPGVFKGRSDARSARTALRAPIRGADAAYARGLS